ncbi:MAG: hypothetical protein LBG89_02645 [Rickettsiales bacterium]|jgi:hypothetical protein|nr:hypothetical protein [Rickettsiales bacterium]
MQTMQQLTLPFGINPAPAISRAADFQPDPNKPLFMIFGELCDLLEKRERAGFDSANLQAKRRISSEEAREADEAEREGFANAGHNAELSDKIAAYRKFLISKNFILYQDSPAEDLGLVKRLRRLGRGEMFSEIDRLSQSVKRMDGKTYYLKRDLDSARASKSKKAAAAEELQSIKKSIVRNLKEIAYMEVFCKILDALIPARPAVSNYAAASNFGHAGR